MADRTKGASRNVPNATANEARSNPSATKKVVINKCYGGFSLSPRALRRIAELQGRKAYFFRQDLKDGLRSPYIGPLTLAEADKAFIVYAFDIPNPNEVLQEKKDWHEQTVAERLAANALYSKHSLDNRPDKRDDPLLVQVVEELGTKANGSHAELKVVEIPADVDFIIDEYDGMESVAETHRTWG